MTKKHDDQAMLDFARDELFPETGFPTHRGKGGFTVKLAYSMQLQKWQSRKTHSDDQVNIQCGRTHVLEYCFASRYIRDYLREMLRAAMVYIDDTNPHCEIKRRGQNGKGFEYLMMDSKGKLKWTRRRSYVMCFKSIDEALIKACRVVFMGGE